MYVVTGATGNTGSVVAKQLLAKGKKVRAIGRNAERLQSLVAQGAEAFVANVADAAAISKAYAGAEGVYLMVPPDVANPDVLAYEERITDALSTAVAQAGVKYAVSLSSFGADKPDKTGPVIGLHHLEEKLNRVSGLNVLHLRAGYFMENTLAQAGIIRSIGKAAGPLRGDLKLPLIATQDIGAAAADALLRLDFTGSATRELLGERDLSMAEATAIIGKAIEKPDLEYLQLPDEQLRPALQQLGMSASMVDLLLEMSAALNSGYMRALEKRSPQNTTPTSFETFVANEFVPRYRGQSRAA